MTHLVAALAKTNVPAAEMASFNGLAKDKQYDKLSSLIGAKELNKRTAAEQKFWDTLAPYQIYAGLLRGWNSTVSVRKFAEGKK